jgi:hypothetical protein
MKSKVFVVGLTLGLLVVATTGYLIGAGTTGRTITTTLVITSTTHFASYLTTTRVDLLTTTRFGTTTVSHEVLSSQGPIAVFPVKYLPPPCPPSNVTGANYYNSTFLITRVDSYTLSKVATWHTNLTAVYHKIIASQNFSQTAQGRFWVVAYWDYYDYGGRPVVESLFILPNSNGSVFGYVHPVFYYFDNSQVSATFTDRLITYCP